MIAYLDRKGRRVKVPRGLRPKPPLNLVRELGAIFGGRIEAWRARFLELFLDAWHVNPLAKRTDAKKEGPSYAGGAFKSEENAKEAARYVHPSSPLIYEPVKVGEKWRLLVVGRADPKDVIPSQSKRAGTQMFELRPGAKPLAPPVATRPPSSWIAHKMSAFRAEVTADLQHHAIGPEIGFVAEKVATRSTKTTGNLLAAMGMPNAGRRLEGVGVRDILGDKIDQFRQENLDKITSLADGEIDTLEGILDDAEASGMRVEDLRKQIQERFDVTRSKADLLARDQVLSLNAKITQSRQTQAGISKYIWSSSGDERVREMHDDLDGTEQAWDDPPVTNEDGDTNHPGEDYQCRCVAIPVIPSIDDLPDADEVDDD